jgi:hypothetical protein
MVAESRAVATISRGVRSDPVAGSAASAVGSSPIAIVPLSAMTQRPAVARRTTPTRQPYGRWLATVRDSWPDNLHA